MIPIYEDLVVESNSELIVGYHGDNKILKIGKQYFRNYPLDKRIVDAYSKVLGFDPQHMLYSLNEFSTQYADDYDYYYKVKMKNPIRAYQIILHIIVI